MTYQVLPDLSEEDFAALKADIAERGVLVPVEYDEDGNVLDGHHRLKACEELGFNEWPRLVREGLTEAEKIHHARQLNLARRQLTKDQRKSLWGQMRAEGMSYRQIAEADGTVNPTTVMRSTVANATVEQPEHVTGKDGKKRRPVSSRVIEDDTTWEGEPFPKRPPVVTLNTGNNEWYTPAPFIEAARKVLGGIDLDPASSEVANRTVGAERIFTAQDDGLSQDWPVGRIWMNPPYAQPLIGQFSERLAKEIGRGSEAIVLVNNATETAWFQRMAEVCNAICFPKTRVRFLRPQGDTGAPLQGQAVIYAGPNVAAFEEAFSAFGLVLRNG